MRALFAIILIFSLFFTTPVVAEETLPTPVGKVVWLKGSLKAVAPNKEERLLQKASIIYLHDTLVTGLESQAQIVFTDNSLMTFKPETKFVIANYEFNPQAKKGSVGKYVMQLIEGGFRTITGLIAKSNPDQYQINTPVATIGVRGTDFAVFFGKGEMFVGYYSGEPCVKNGGGTVCLNAQNQFARVDNMNVKPVVVPQQPAVFKQKLDIVPTKIAPFASAAGTTPPGGSTGSTGTTGTTGGTSTTTTTVPGAVQQKTGPINSFCITN